MAASILIRYLWHMWIQACWLNQGYGEGRRCVSVYSRKKNACTELCELDIVDDHNECVFAELLLNGQTYIVGVVNRPPNSNIVDFNNTMHSILGEGDTVSLLHYGRLNLDLLKHDKYPPTEKYLDIMHVNYFIPIINRPTRVTRDTSTLIDNIYTNNYNIKKLQLQWTACYRYLRPFSSVSLIKKMQWTLY